MPLALEASKDNSVAQELLQKSITPFRRGEKKRPIEDDTPAQEESFGRELDDLLPDSQGQVKNNRYDRKLKHETSSIEEPAPKPKRKSILERV